VPKTSVGQPPHGLATQHSPPPITSARRDGRTFSVVLVRPGRRIALRASPGGRALAVVGPKTEYGSTTTMAVAATRRGGWLGLTSSDVPNGRLGWVKASNRSIEIRSTQMSVHIDLSRRRLVLRNGHDVVRRATVGIGRFGSSTPPGRFSVTDELRGSAFGRVYGCCILALSGRQTHPPKGWLGGNRLAIHGTNNSGSIGARASAGCLHAKTDDLRVLMRRVPLGTPVFIRS
jgi:lipoprotein-anchoring transpeptidase ErfK/SrfK